MCSEIVVVGAGGHAKVCIELLRAMGEKVAYCIGDEDAVEYCMQIPVLRGDEHIARLYKQGFSRAFIAIGSNSLRGKLSQIASAQGYDLVNAISPYAMISPSAKLGRGVAVMAGAIINAETVIEDLAIINTGATIDHDCWIGRGSHIAPQCALAGNVRVGAYSFLGVGTKVMPNVQIGEEVVVGAGGVIISNLPSSIKAVGIPAKIISQEIL